MSTTKKTLSIFLLIAHGSRRPESNNEIITLTQSLRGRLTNSTCSISHYDTNHYDTTHYDTNHYDTTHYDIVDCCFLELGTPSLEDYVNTLFRQYTDAEFSIDFLPYFLSSGNHVEKDIPAKLSKIRQRDRIIQCNLLDYIGKDAGLLDLLTQRINQSHRS